MRVLLSRVRSVLAAAAVVGAVALMAGWVVTRVVTDQWVWSQWVWWVPGWATAGAVGVLMAASRAMRRDRARGRLVRRIGWIGVGVVLGWTGVVEWRWWAWPARMWAGAASGEIRVVAWNPAMMPSPGAGRMLAGLAPDVMVMNNPPAEVDWEAVKGAMGESATYVRIGQFAVVSRWPLLRAGTTDLGLKGLIFGYDTVDYTPEVSDRYDPGRAGFFEIDTRERLGRTMTVWAVDLPSDPLLGRAAMMREARGVIDAWEGEERRWEDGKIARTLSGSRGFPAPDLIVGDFNSPRGSGSIAALTGGMTSAYSQGGVGADGTWPRMLPVFHIDQMFVAGWLRAAEYRVVDPGETMHRVQVGEIVRAK